MIVDVFGIEAFLPGSQIDVKPIRDYDVYVGKTMEFKVVKINLLNILGASKQFNYILFLVFKGFFHEQ